MFSSIVASLTFVTVHLVVVAHLTIIACLTITTLLHLQEFHHYCTSQPSRILPLSCVSLLPRVSPPSYVWFSSSLFQRSAMQGVVETTHSQFHEIKCATLDVSDVSFLLETVSWDNKPNKHISLEMPLD
ncbi:hypothetical protein VNO78_09716 [Psophocarpus tetragonolobus]|uniref:Uncharacterized protein n=1 Tax=Psophocarpus tetragonolobus TaxID=3891 RepID=A0AAN9T8K7_PSOTE